MCGGAYRRCEAFLGEWCVRHRVECAVWRRRGRYFFRWKAEYIGQRPFWTKPSCLRDFCGIWGRCSNFIWCKTAYRNGCFKSGDRKYACLFIRARGRDPFFDTGYGFFSGRSEIAGNSVKSWRMDEHRCGSFSDRTQCKRYVWNTAKTADSNGSKGICRWFSCRTSTGYDQSYAI